MISEASDRLLKAQEACLDRDILTSFEGFCTPLSQSLKFQRSEISNLRIQKRKGLNFFFFSILNFTSKMGLAGVSFIGVKHNEYC